MPNPYTPMIAEGEGVILSSISEGEGVILSSISEGEGVILSSISEGEGVRAQKKILCPYLIAKLRFEGTK